MNGPLLIQWTHENNLGIPIIDDQHRGIVSVINSLGLFIRHHKNDFFLATAANMMDSYTKLHFATEEELLVTAGYSRLNEHKQLHADLIRESFSLANESMRLKEPTLYLRFLKEWWMNHINMCDRSYADEVKAYLAIQPPEQAFVL